MRTGELFAFACWVASKASFGAVSKFQNFNENFRSKLDDDPGLSSVGWVAITLLIGCAWALIVMLLDVSLFDMQISKSAYAVQFFLLSTYLSVIWYIYHGVQVLWDAFQRDRQRVFDLLKD